MVTEEIAFSGSHQLRASDVIKWVPLAQGHCAGYDGPEHGELLLHRAHLCIALVDELERELLAGQLARQ